MKTAMNPIGITHNLDRARIRKLLLIGLFGAILTGIGDFLLGYGEGEAAAGFAQSLLASAASLSDGQLIWGGLLGVPGLFLEGLGFFAIYRLMADAAPKYAHIYRSGIFGYIALAPVGCHMNVGLMNLAYKLLLPLDAGAADQAAEIMVYAFCLPLWVLLIAFWLPMLAVQFKAFSKGWTPCPGYAKWFNLPVGMLPALLLSAVIGPGTALGGAIGTMFLSFGNAFIFGGLLAVLPSQDRFDAFEKSLKKQ